MKKAVIYVRVSTGKQVEGASLDTQEAACQQWCANHEILIDSIYREEGASAKTIDGRPKMKEMLADLANSKDRVQYVVTYQTDRISRSMDDFVFLRTVLRKLGIEYKNTNSSLKSDASETLVMNISAAMAEYDNQQKSERVSDNMKVKARLGHRMSKAPFGLKNVRDVLKVSTVAPVEGIASKVANVLEAYATGTHTVSSLLKLCKDINLKSASGKPMQIQAISKMLRNPIYAGLEQNIHTGGELIASTFEGIITPATFYRNQELLKSNKNTAARYKKNNPEFPLRRFMLCMECNKPLTGSKPTDGSGRPSPRYHCSRCHLPSIKVEEMHEQFLHLLSSLKPDPDMERFLKEVIVRVWREETKTLSSKQMKLHRVLEQLTAQKTKTIELLVEGKITTDEKNDLVAKINTEYEASKKELASISTLSDLKADTIDYALQFMSNAPRIWSNASIEHQIIYQKLVFPAGVTYDLSKNEFGTPKLSTLYRLATIKKDPSMTDKSLMVTSRGIEPRLPG